MIVYASRTGNVKNIVEKLIIPSIKIEDGLIIDKPFLLFTYTDGLGAVPKIVEEFMEYEDNWKSCRGVIASGNTNFGNHVFCGSADKISRKYNIPVVHKVELRGFEKDYKYITDKYKEIIEKG